MIANNLQKNSKGQKAKVDRDKIVTTAIVCGRGSAHSVYTPRSVDWMQLSGCLFEAGLPC